MRRVRGRRQVSRISTARRLAWLIVVGLLTSAGPPAAGAPPVDGLALTDRLDVSDRAAVERAVGEIERAPTETPNLDEALREAARTCEDVLADPVRALALYERILREFPDGSASRVAGVRVGLLRDRVGEHNAYAREANELAQLVRDADRVPAAEVERRAEALVARAWPGAPDAALFLAEWLQRTGQLAAADARFAVVVARWPGTPQGLAAQRGGAGVAIAARDWDRAEQLTRALPTTEPADLVLRDELVERIARGRQLDFWYAVSWIALVACGLLLLGSLAEATLRGGRRWPHWRPPVEVMFLGPVAAVLVGVALTTHRAIAPAVAILSLGGVALAWVSGITLELVRARGRAFGLRAAVHVAACFVAVAAIAYLVLAHDNLLEMVIETVRFGPD